MKESIETIELRTERMASDPDDDRLTDGGEPSDDRDARRILCTGAIGGAIGVGALGAAVGAPPAASAGPSSASP